MSWEATALVKPMTHTAQGVKLTPTEKLVLMVLSDSVSPDTGYAWPSVPTLARLCLSSERTVQYSLRKLEEGKLIRSEKFDGRKTKFYVLAIQPALNFTPADSAPVQPSVKTGATQRTKSKPILNEPNSAEVKTFPRSQPFEESPNFKLFWLAYPRKDGKQEAQKAWIKKLCDGHDEEIAASLAAWKLTRQWVEGFVPYAATWINKGLHKEFPEPEVGNGTRSTSRADKRRDDGQKISQDIFGRTSGLVGAFASSLEGRPVARIGAGLSGDAGGSSAPSTAPRLPASSEELQVPAQPRRNSRSG